MWRMKSPGNRRAGRAPEAERRIRASGERLTAPRAAVLAALIGSGRALTHHEIGQALRRRAVDRVTIYRVLEWLTASGLAHRIAGDDRVWRFVASRPGAGAHAHFTCSSCGRTICLDRVAVRAPSRVPRGWVLREVEMNLKGLCASCH